jgi:hypothetical protein
VKSDLATDEPVGTLEVVATFLGPMPTGVTVSHSGRIFVSYPKWGDEVPDKRRKPYGLFRVAIDARPVLLRP